MVKALLLSLLLVILAAPAVASAAPVSNLVLNEKTKQCARVFAGDECTDCFPVSDDWKLAEPGMGRECPKDYEMVRVELARRCQGFKIPRCCTKGHSGAQGDCEDMVINDDLKKCAFVDDIKDCRLPRGWKRNPQATPTREWECPYGTSAWGELKCVNAK